MKTNQEVLRTFEAAVRIANGGAPRVPQGFPGFSEWKRDLEVWSGGLDQKHKVTAPVAALGKLLGQFLTVCDVGRYSSSYANRMILRVDEGQAKAFGKLADNIVRQVRLIADLMGPRAPRELTILKGYPRYIKNWVQFFGELDDYLDDLADQIANRHEGRKKFWEEVLAELAPLGARAISPMGKGSPRSHGFEGQTYAGAGVGSIEKEVSRGTQYEEEVSDLLAEWDDPPAEKADLWVRVDFRDDDTDESPQVGGFYDVEGASKTLWWETDIKYDLNVYLKKPDEVARDLFKKLWPSGGGLPKADGWDFT